MATDVVKGIISAASTSASALRREARNVIEKPSIQFELCKDQRHAKCTGAQIQTCAKITDRRTPPDRPPSGTA
jgi:hypothetical protein